MKLECPKKVLGEAISKAEKITGKNVTLPVLKCILLETKGNMLSVKATNLDLGLEIAIPINSKVDGKVAVPGSLLSSFLQNLPDDVRVVMELENENVRISTPTTSTLIKTLPADDFPAIPALSEGNRFLIKAKDLVGGLKSVGFSAAVSSMKPELSSVYVYPNADKELVFAATDSFRLAEKRVETKVPKGFTSMLIPARNIPDIVRLFENLDGDIEILADKNQVSFSLENIYLVSRIVDGVFPDYKQIIPEGFKTEAIMLKQDLMHSLKLTSIFADKFNQVNFNISPSSKKAEITTKNNEVGESSNTIEAALSGENIEINVMQKYVSDCFSSIESDSVSLQFNGPGRPIVIRGVSSPAFMYLVMPMNR